MFTFSQNLRIIILTIFYFFISMVMFIIEIYFLRKTFVLKIFKGGFFIDTTNILLIAVIAIMLTTGVAAYGLNNADDGGSGLFDQGSHSKVSHDKKSVHSGKNKNSDGKSSGDITLDVTMQQNVNNYLFNIPTAYILDIDEYNENNYIYTQKYLPDDDEYDWEIDIEVLEFDKANGRDLTQEDVESYATGDYEETTINGITGYYSQDGDWETFVFGSGNEVFTVSVYGISLEVVLNDFTQEPLVGDTQIEEDTSSEEEMTDDSSSDDSDYDDSSSDDSYYDDSDYEDDSYYDYEDYDEDY